jgi:hypothetical protein
MVKELEPMAAICKLTVLVWGSDMILTVYILGAGLVMGYLIYKEETK